MSNTKDLYLIDKMINPDNVDADIDLVAIEKQMLNKGYIDKANSDDDSNYKTTLANIHKKMDLPSEDGRRSTKPKRSNRDKSSSESSGSYETGSETGSSYETESGSSRSGSSRSSSGSARSKYSTRSKKSRKEPSKTVNDLQTEDSKALMIEEIDFLRSDLQEAGKSLAGMQSVTQHSSYADISAALRLLQYKSNRIKNSEFTDGIIMLGVYGLEEAFNGKRNYFGFYPDLDGWGKTVTPKLRRMQAETSQIASEIINDYGISPIARIALELGPSAFIYSRVKRNNTMVEKINDDPKLIEAMENIRNF